MQGRPFGAVKYAMKSLDVKPEWCEGHVTLARAQREMGEVNLSLESYKKAIALLDEATSLNENEKEELVFLSHFFVYIILTFKSKYIIIRSIEA